MSLSAGIKKYKKKPTSISVYVRDVYQDGANILRSAQHTRRAISMKICDLHLNSIREGSLAQYIYSFS